MSGAREVPGASQKHRFLTILTDPRIIIDDPDLLGCIAHRAHDLICRPPRLSAPKC